MNNIKREGNFPRVWAKLQTHHSQTLAHDGDDDSSVDKGDDEHPPLQELVMRHAELGPHPLTTSPLKFSRDNCYNFLLLIIKKSDTNIAPPI